MVLERPTRAVEILGCRVDDVTLDEAAAACDRLIQRQRPSYVVTPNAEIIFRAQHDPELRRLINAADLSIPDGAGLLLAGRLLRTPLREQVAGTDLCWRLAELCAARGYRLFLLGGEEGVAAGAARQLRDRHPRLQIAGSFGGSADPSGDKAARAALGACRPIDVLLVAYGAPRQELWIARNQGRLGVPLAMGVGGALDFISGRVSRAPAWMRRLGLDWLYRLLRQPWRWRRQLALPAFVWLVLRSAARGRSDRSSSTDQ